MDDCGPGSYGLHRYARSIGLCVLPPLALITRARTSYVSWTKPATNLRLVLPCVARRDINIHAKRKPWLWSQQVDYSAMFLLHVVHAFSARHIPTTAQYLPCSWKQNLYKADYVSLLRHSATLKCLLRVTVIVSKKINQRAPMFFLRFVCASSARRKPDPRNPCCWDKRIATL
jgi:hypothetical protein